MLTYSSHATFLKTGRRQLVMAGSKLKKTSASPNCQYHTPTQFISRDHSVYSLCNELLNTHRSFFHLFVQTYLLNIIETIHKIIHSIEKVGSFIKSSVHSLTHFKTITFDSVLYSRKLLNTSI